MNDWVQVDNAWPREGEWVLLAFEGSVEQGYQLDGKKFFLSRTDGQDDQIQVWPTHWMPLPDPPAWPPKQKDAK